MPILKPLRILYVEDNYNIREQIAELLGCNDNEVWSCETAEEALIVFAKRQFDVLVTDVSLPGLSGMELARRVLATDPNYWVVLCSGYEFRLGLAELGPHVRSLDKPFDAKALEALFGEIASAGLKNARVP